MEQIKVQISSQIKRRLTAALHNCGVFHNWKLLFHKEIIY